MRSFIIFQFHSPKIPLKFRRISVRAQLRTEGCAGEFQRNSGMNLRNFRIGIQVLQVKLAKEL